MADFYSTLDPAEIAFKTDMEAYRSQAEIQVFPGGVPTDYQLKAESDNVVQAVCYILWKSGISTSKARADALKAEADTKVAEAALKAALFGS